MRRLVVVLAALYFTAMPVVAAAQSPVEIAAELDDGIFIDEGLSPDLERLQDAVGRARNAGLAFSVVLLEEDPSSGATVFADAVLDQLGSGTVLVLSATGEGMASTEVDQSVIEAALDSGFAAGGGDEGYVDAAVALLTGGGSTAATPAGEGGGSTGLIITVAIIGGLVLLAWIAIQRSQKASARRRRYLVAEARTEIKAQLDAMANTILEITDTVSASSSPEDNEYLEKAGTTYSAALESYETAADLRALEDLSDRLDEARWQLDAAAAIAAGRPVPPQPEKEERAACFFDPTHRDATEMVDIETSSGTRTVRVCAADAERLRKGSRPDPRMISVEGRRVPAPMAPRSHGGGGMDALDIFSVLAGGAGEAASYDWGGRRTRRSRRRSSRSRQSLPGRGWARAGRTRRRRR